MDVRRLRDSLPDQGSVADAGPGTAKAPLLLVDDDVHMLRALAFYFERRGFEVITADSFAAAKSEYLRLARWSLVIADFSLPDGNGWELYRWTSEQKPAAPPFLLISGGTVPADCVSAVEFLAKPFSLDELSSRVGALLAARR
ncbi:MAG TPA: response regulator [Opitutaceae bacterium]|nr:response regulator [Opitutaceae bacterium]